MALKFFNLDATNDTKDLLCDFVATVLVLSASGERLLVLDLLS